MLRGCKRFAPLLGLVVAAVLLAGCVPVDKGRFASLKDATQTLSKGAEETYAGVASLQAQHLAQLAKETEAFPANLENYLTRQGKLSDTDAKMNDGMLYQRQILESISRYAELLYALAATDFTDDVEAASLKLDVSLTKLIKQWNPDKADTFAKPVGALSAAVRWGGLVYIEALRVKKLQAVMDLGQPALKRLHEEYSVNQDGVRLYARNAAAPLYDDLVHARRPGKDKADRAVDPEIAKVASKYDAVVNSLDGMKASLEKLLKAHEVLRASLDKKPETMDALIAFMAEVQATAAFYKKTQNN